MQKLRFSLLALLVSSGLQAEAAQKGAFDGNWTFTRNTSSGCGDMGSEFHVRIAGNVAKGPGGVGRVSSDGRIRVPGLSNVFTGRLQGDSGSGSYNGKCPGNFTATRN
jgi:hypothetical protein